MQKHRIKFDRLEQENDAWFSRLHMITRVASRREIKMQKHRIKFDRLEQENHAWFSWLHMITRWRFEFGLSVILLQCARGW